MGYPKRHILVPRSKMDGLTLSEWSQRWYGRRKASFQIGDMNSASYWLVGYEHGCPDRRSGMVRSGPWSGFLVRDFIWSGTWSGFWSGFFLVRYVVRNSVRKSAPGRIIRTGPDFGPDFQTDENSKKKILNESGSLIIIEKIRTNFRTGPS